MTEAQIKALKIIEQLGIVDGFSFATEMWNDSNMMNHPRWKIIRNGNSYLFKLFNKGFLLKHDYKYPQFRLSVKGQEVLKELEG